ncbi:MAG: zinc-ribbon domain-containing protein [Candidatus Cryosericum sp.]
MRRSCRNCGAELSDDATFCAVCGSAVSAPQSTEQTTSAPKAADAFVKKRGMPSRKILISAIAVVLILAVGIGVLLRFFGGDGDPFVKGATVEQAVRPDGETTVGDLSQTGWQLDIPAYAFFESDLTLTMSVLSETERENYQNDAFEWIGTPVKITAGSENGVYLDRPVTVTMQIPKEQRTPKEKVDDYLAAYYNGESWDYIFPDVTRVSEGYVTFETYHFSLFSAVKPTEEEKIKLYTQKMAVQIWEDEEREKALSNKVMDTFNEAFEEMGISDETVKGKLLRSVAKESDFGTLVASTERGDVADFGVKCGEMAANALIKQLKMEDALMDNITGKGAAVATGLVKGALQLKDGNYTDAAKELSSAFIGYFPAGRAYQAAVEVIDAGIASWKDYELDEAYRNYVKDTSGGFATVSDDDWALMCATQMRGYLIRLQDEAKNNYCAVNGISRSELDKDEGLSVRIAGQAGANLRKTFEKRLASEKTVKGKEAEYAKVIEGFKKDLLLERGSFGFGFDTDIESRLRTLFAVRKNILDLFGGEMPVLKSGESAQANLNEAIAMWISFGPEKRGEFYQWLEEKGYIGKVKPSAAPAAPSASANNEAPASSAPVSASQPTAEKEYAWVLTETKTNDWQSKLDAQNKKTAGSWRLDIAASAGSATFTETYLAKDYLWMKQGMSQSGQVTWTAPSRTIIRPNEEFSIDLTVTHLHNDHSNQSGGWWGKAQVFYIDEAGEQKGSATDLRDRDGKSSFTSSKSKKYQSFSPTVYGTFGAGSEGDRMAIRVLASGGVVGVQTLYIYEWKEVT